MRQVLLGLGQSVAVASNRSADMCLGWNETDSKFGKEVQRQGGRDCCR